jgi:hypothetical protein
MNEFYEDPYLEDNIDDFSWKYFEIEAVNTISELSRQLRTYLKYKEQIIKNRFQSSFIPHENQYDLKFIRNKKELQDLAFEFIQILKKIKKDGNSVEQRIYHNLVNINGITTRHLIGITRKMFDLIHYFSEQELYNKLDFLRFIFKLAQEALAVKKCLDHDLEDFYAELKICYEALVEELECILTQKVPIKKDFQKKMSEDRIQA